MPTRACDANTVARGILLLGVFHVHALYVLAYGLPSPDAGPLTFVQIKLLSPLVSVFFVLAGMTAPAIGQKPFQVVAARSLALYLLACASHLVGVPLEWLVLRDPVAPWIWSERTADLLLPLVTGTRFSTHVAWFMSVLATTRLLAWLWQRNRLACCAVLGNLVAAGQLMEVADLGQNIHEWRNLPAAVAFFLLGTWLPKRMDIPAIRVLSLTVVVVFIGLINRPALFVDGICLDCDPQFAADQMVGRWGAAPLFFLQQVAAAFMILGVSRGIAPTPLGAAVGYFGRHSLLMLLLHGWMILTIYPLLAGFAPDGDRGFVFLAVFAINVVLHAALFRVTERGLKACLALCSEVARRLVDALAGIGTQGTAPSRGRSGSLAATD